MSALTDAVKNLISGTNSEFSSSNMVGVRNNNMMLLGEIPGSC